jgi:SAM-dependent methyltransferase
MDNRNGMSPAMDFDTYAETKAMCGPIPESWIEPFRKYVLDPMEIRSDARILDFGFGDGRFFEYFLRYFSPDNVHGVEVSRVRTERAHARGWRRAIHLNVKDPLPYPEQWFQFVNMVEVIEHIPTDTIGPCLSQITRVLAPKGVLIATTPNYPIKRLYDILDAVRLRQWARLRDDPTHVSFYNHRRLRAVLVPHFDEVMFLPYKQGILYARTGIELLCHKILAICKGPRNTALRHKS